MLGDRTKYRAVLYFVPEQTFFFMKKRKKEKPEEGKGTDILWNGCKWKSVMSIVMYPGASIVRPTTLHPSAITFP